MESVYLFCTGKRRRKRIARRDLAVCITILAHQRALARSALASDKSAVLVGLTPLEADHCWASNKVDLLIVQREFRSFMCDLIREQDWAACKDGKSIGRMGYGTRSFEKTDSQPLICKYAPMGRKPFQ